MDQRQTQIREGAGLEESKLNVEFIDWLRRWSTPLLTLAAVAALSWVLYQRVEKAGLVKVDRAFSELETAMATGSPESLKAVADDYDKVRAVPHLARLAAADAYLRAARTGLRPGANLKQDGTADPADMLDDKGRLEMLDNAARMYTLVMSRTAPDVREAVHAVSAGFGAGAVAESRGQADEAKKVYDEVVKIAETAGLPDLAEVAKKRIADLPNRMTVPVLYAKAELPTPPAPPPPPAPPAPTGMSAAPVGLPPPPPAAPTGPTGTPAPTGAPAPTGTPPAAPTGTPAPEAPTGPTGAPAPTGTPVPAPTGTPAPSGVQPKQ